MTLRLTVYALAAPLWSVFAYAALGAEVVDVFVLFSGSYWLTTGAWLYLEGRS